MKQSETKTCQSCKAEFIIEPDDFGFYEKIGVPAPTFCPDCRRQRRMTWRNEHHFYPRQCAKCSKNILSVYSSDKPRIIYCPKCWWSDGWNAKDYALDIDWDTDFFVQYKQLLEKVPALAIYNDNDIVSKNCEYTNYFARGKDCYLTTNCWKVENVMYSLCILEARDIMDSGFLYDGGEQLYHALYSMKSSRSRYIYNSVELVDCAFCFDCRGCTSCFMSANLRNKSYCFKNKQYSKEEYQAILKKYQLDTHSGMERAKKEFREFMFTQLHRDVYMNNSVNCTGQYLYNCKNAKDCYVAVRVEDSRYFERGDTVKDSYDCLTGGEQELCYESINPDHCNGAFFTNYCHTDNDIWYSDSCQSSENIFGCVSLKSASYSIFNKQYDKEEYKKLKSKLIEQMKKAGQWGEFFPSNLSPFCYNETMAQDAFPLTKNGVSAKGLTWQDKFAKTEGKETITEIPESINDVDNQIVKEVLVCNTCKRNYKIIERELQFYKVNQIPIPRQCFYCRLAKLYEEMGPMHLWTRQCMCDYKTYKNTAIHGHHKEGRCPNEFETSYSPDRPEIVYCEKCYQAEII